MQPDPAACCPDAFYCPASAETRCPRHGGFVVCCDKPELHVPMDRDAWHQAQERLEQRWLNGYIRDRNLYRGKGQGLPPFWDVDLSPSRRT